jgi:50S ribosomal protein L16 3-hydroxylase
MDIHQSLDLLGGMTPATFMKKHWQRKPLLVRQAFSDFTPPLSKSALRKMSKRDDVESRLIWKEQGRWQMEPGPFSSLPRINEPDWTLLIQSADIHDDGCAQLLHQFRFMPDVRLDDLMISIATKGGGVGPHFDSYDVFLIQGQGRRLWRFGQQKNLDLVPDLPLKILKHFEPEQEFILEPGDMLYLPPQAAHDGIALDDDCMTLSVGFRAPDARMLACGMLEIAAEMTAEANRPARPYRDPGQPATDLPALIPDQLIQAAIKAAQAVKLNESIATRFLGCWLTEPNRLAVFDAVDPERVDEWMAREGPRKQWVLDRRSRMLYRGNELFINGEHTGLKPEPGLVTLANERCLDADSAAAKKLSEDAFDALRIWIEDGWVKIKS